MKLLLTELQYQDPTSPMDTEKMLTQTSQLASLEMQENTNKMMQKLADQLKNSTNMYAVGVLGKMAKIGDSGIVKEEGSGVKFAGFLESAAKGGTINIKDGTGKLVRKLEFGQASAGANTFEWDGKDSAGNDQLHRCSGQRQKRRRRQLSRRRCQIYRRHRAGKGRRTIRQHRQSKRIYRAEKRIGRW